MKKIFAIIALSIFTWMKANAQGESYFDYNDNYRNVPTELGGLSSVVFVSKIPNLIITTQEESDPQPQKTVNNSGLYEYEIVVDLAKQRGERHFTISKEGTVYTTKISKKTLKKNNRLYITIEEPERFVRLINHSRPTDYDKDNRIIIEITTSLNDLSIDGTKDNPIVSDVISSVSHSGLNLKRIVINLEKLKELISSYEALEKEKYQLEAKMSRQTLTEDEFSRLDLVKDSLLQELNDSIGLVTSITLKATGTNRMQIPSDDILSLAKGVNKLSYATEGGTEIKEVFGDANKQTINLAETEFNRRNYVEAAKIYRNAMSDPDATVDQKQFYETKAVEMEQLRDLKRALNTQVHNINEMKKAGGMIDYNKLEELYKAAMANCDELYRYHRHEYYPETSVKLKSALEGLGQVITGAITKGGYHQGVSKHEPLHHVSIYGVKYYFEKSMKKGTPAGADLLGSADEKGLFHVQFEKGKYSGLLFVPVTPDIDKIKNENQYYPLDGTKHMNLKVNFYDK